jgi:dTDP-4-dehydrorhamnose 3,5-epimerase-like enzyme
MINKLNEMGDLMLVHETKVQMLTFKENGDERGKLVVVEGLRDIPFDIKRIFYIYGSDREVIRGCHANRKTEFVLINVCGSSKVKIKYGYTEEIFILDKPHTGIYLPKMTWKEMYDFSSDSILLVLASEIYETKEYIRNFEEYLKERWENE